MSRILPLEKDVNLDKRYINETETITENALESVINAGGGGGGSSYSYVECTSLNWPLDFTTDGETAPSKTEACEALGIDEDELDAIMNGQLRCNLLVHLQKNSLFDAIAYYANRVVVSGESASTTVVWDLVLSDLSDTGWLNIRKGIGIRMNAGGTYTIFGTKTHIN